MPSRLIDSFSAPELRRWLEVANAEKVAGDAFNDHFLIDNYYTITEVALACNFPDVAFEAMDVMGVRVMGLEPMKWEEFSRTIKELAELRP